MSVSFVSFFELIFSIFRAVNVILANLLHICCFYQLDADDFCRVLSYASLHPAQRALGFVMFPVKRFANDPRGQTWFPRYPALGSGE